VERLEFSINGVMEIAYPFEKKLCLYLTLYLKIDYMRASLKDYKTFRRQYNRMSSRSLGRKGFFIHGRKSTNQLGTSGSCL
jgi:hypothetical protein